MSNAKTILFLPLVIFASMVVSVPAEEVKNQPDQLSQMLFDTYITRPPQSGGTTVMAASHIVAERGRNTGFWKTVLRELQTGKDQSEIGCVRVLGKMLAIDAAARDAIRRQKETGQVDQIFASVLLGPEVVKELVTRGSSADRFRIDHYAIALARARVPETKEFLRMILRDDTGQHYMPSAKFHAAVGLAQLGESDGFAWLIDNSEDPLHTISHAWPVQAPNDNLDKCAGAALRDLSGEKNLKSKRDWELWWDKVDKRDLPKGHVRMDDQKIIITEPNGAAIGSQPFRSETNSTSPTAGSRR